MIKTTAQNRVTVFRLKGGAFDWSVLALMLADAGKNAGGWRANSNAFHQIAHLHFKRVSDGLNGKQRRILQTALNAAQEGAVNVRVGGQRLLGKIAFQARFPDALAELFCDVMAHSPLY